MQELESIHKSLDLVLKFKITGNVKNYEEWQKFECGLKSIKLISTITSFCYSFIYVFQLFF